MWKVELLYTQGVRSDIRTLACEFFELDHQQLTFYSGTRTVVLQLDFPTLQTAYGSNFEGGCPRLYFTGVERVNKGRYYQSICCSFKPDSVQVADESLSSLVLSELPETG